MNAPKVDVLAVLRRMNVQAKAYRGAGAGSGTQQLHDEAAIAAVVDLIATQRETLRMLEAAYRQLGMWTDDNRRIQRAKAALANMGTQS